MGDPLAHEQAIENAGVRDGEIEPFLSFQRSDHPGRPGGYRRWQGLSRTVSQSSSPISTFISSRLEMALRRSMLKPSGWPLALMNS
jgi:hypothetical protein